MKTTTSGLCEKPALQRTLSNRHIQLMAMGGAIGTGLFMGSGKIICAVRHLDHPDLHDHRAVCVLRDARHGRAAAVQPQLQELCRLCRRLPGTARRVFSRLVVLAKLERGGGGGCGGGRRVFPVLVPGPAGVDAGGGHAVNVVRVECADCQVVRRSGVSVRNHQDHRRGDPDRRERGADRSARLSRPPASLHRCRICWTNRRRFPTACSAFSPGSRWRFSPLPAPS